MNKNVKIAKELVRLARKLMESGDMMHTFRKAATLYDEHIKEALNDPENTKILDAVDIDISLLDKFPRAFDALVTDLQKDDFSAYAVLADNPSVIEKYSKIKKAFLNGLKKGYHWAFNVLDRRIELIGKYPEAKNAVVEGLKTPGKVDFMLTDPNLSLFDNYPEILKIFADRLKNGDKFVNEFLAFHLFLIDKFPEINDALVEELKNGNNFAVMRYGKDFFDRYPAMKNVFIDRLKNGDEWALDAALNSYPSWIIKYDDIRDAVVEVMIKENKWFILERNPALLLSPEVRKVFVENLKAGGKKESDIVYSNLFWIFDNFPEIKDAFIEGLTNGERWANRLLHSVPKMIERYPEIKRFLR